MEKRMSRRQLLKLLGAVAGKVGLGALAGCATSVGNAADDDLETRAYLPMVQSPEATPTPMATPENTQTPMPTNTSTPIATNTPILTLPVPPDGSRVVHVHSSSATSWDFSTGWYGDYVNQSVINNMVDEGLKQLTGQSTVTDAWQTLLPDYSPGKGIAIKVSFNNCWVCDDSDNIIDGLIEPVNSLVKGMKELSVQEQDILVYDTSRCLPDRFRTRCAYPGVRFFDVDGKCAERSSYDSTDPDAQINFSHANITPRKLCDILVNATYLINMPIVKDHMYASVSLGFKNHFGSIDRVNGPGADHLHYYLANPYCNPDYSPILDIWANPHIRSKTVLTVGDCLYGSLGNPNLEPTRWSTFGNDAANSMFFATDPVAAECVMWDILDAEPVYHPRPIGCDSYLQLAANAGWGVCERGDPWGSGYNRINYIRVNM